LKRERRHFNLDFKLEATQALLRTANNSEENPMTLFRLDASIRVEGSASREIADIVEQEWLAAHPGDAVSAAYVPAESRTPEQTEAVALATTLVDELVAADAILFAVPLYNYGVSQHIKTYFDLVLTDPRAKEDARMLAGKPVVLATVRGGAYGEGTPRHGWDHSTPYLRRVLGDIWASDLTVVEREFTLVGVVPNLDPFTDMAAEMHQGALEAAREAGRALGAPARV
jgi:FMN-dependent NADH-azoreductase